jgi:AAA domain
MASRDANDVDREHGAAGVLKVNDSGVTVTQPLVNGIGADCSIEPTPFNWSDPCYFPTRQWIYNKHYIRRYTSTTIGATKVGKTSLVLAEALVMVTGKPLLGIKPRESCPVWIWNGEDPLDELERRVLAAMMLYGIKREEVEGRLFLDSGRKQPIVIATQTRQGTVIAQPVEDRLIDRLKGLDIGVLIIDPFVSCHRVPENDNPAIDAVVKTWGRIAGEANCGVELPMHIRKGNGDEVTIDDARGGSAITAATRCTRVVNRMTSDEAEQAVIEDRKTYFRIDDAGGNLSPPAEESEWYQIVSVELGNGDERNPGDRVGAVRKWEWPSLFAENAPGDLAAVQRRIAQGEWRESSQSTDWAGKAVAEVLGLDLTEKAARKRVKQMLAAWIKNRALKVVSRKDNKRMDRKWIEVGDLAHE